MNVLFVCDRCNCVDTRDLAPAPLNGQWLCSGCHPQSAKWHGEFLKETYNPNTDIVCNRSSGIGLG